MFEVRCPVVASKLEDVLLALQDLGCKPQVSVTEGSAPHSKPWTKAPRPNKVSNRKAQAKVDGGGEKIVRDLIVSHPGDIITARQMRTAVMSHGYSQGAYSHALKLLKKAGKLADSGTTGHYRILRGPAQHGA